MRSERGFPEPNYVRSQTRRVWLSTEPTPKTNRPLESKWGNRRTLFGSAVERGLPREPVARELVRDRRRSRYGAKNESSTGAFTVPSHAWKEAGLEVARNCIEGAGASQDSGGWT